MEFRRNGRNGHDPRFFAEKLNAMEQVIQHAAMILSNMTNYTSILLGPEVFHTSLRHFQLLPLDDTTAVVVSSQVRGKLRIVR